MIYPTTHKSLLERIRCGDDVSWQEFYNKYAPIIRFTGKLYNFNDTECDDLVQNVMVKFFDHSKKFVYRENQVKFRSYFSRIIRSQAVDHIRRNRHNDRYMPDDQVCDPFAGIFLEEWKKIVIDEAIDEMRTRLDVKTFQAFELYAWQKRDINEVAKVLNMSKDQLYAAKSRGLKMLKEIISRRNQEDGELDIEIQER